MTTFNAVDCRECPVCFDCYQDPRIIGLCGHSICLECCRSLYQRSRNSTLVCPLCQKICTVPEDGIDGLPRNWALGHLMDSFDYLRSNSSMTGSLNRKDQDDGLEIECSECFRWLHKDVAMVCEKCNRLICTLCCVRQHRFCDNVAEFSDSLAKSRSIMEARSADLNLKYDKFQKQNEQNDQTVQKLTQFLQVYKRTKSELETIYQETLADLQNCSEKMEHYFAMKTILSKAGETDRAIYKLMLTTQGQSKVFNKIATIKLLDMKSDKVASGLRQRNNSLPSRLDTAQNSLRSISVPTLAATLPQTSLLQHQQNHESPPLSIIKHDEDAEEEDDNFYEIIKNCPSVPQEQHSTSSDTLHSSGETSITTAPASSSKHTSEVEPTPDSTHLRIAAHPFNAFEDTMVDVSVNETVFLVERFIDDSGWSYVRKENGREGWMPTSYLTQPSTVNKNLVDETDSQSYFDTSTISATASLVQNNARRSQEDYEPVQNDTPSFNNTNNQKPLIRVVSKKQPPTESRSKQENRSKPNAQKTTPRNTFLSFVNRNKYEKL